jgi:hypothetical protein
LQEHHENGIGSILPVKKDRTKDLLTIFSDLVYVRFKWAGRYQKLRGQWCMPLQVSVNILHRNLDKVAHQMIESMKKW